MSKVLRDYCNKDKHFKWKAWTCYYTNGLCTIKCNFCGKELQGTQIVAWGWPKKPLP